MEARLEPMTITCPRCGQDTVARFFGPCDDCRTDLRDRLGAEGRQVEAPAYDPKMNVTPNFIATKD